MVVRQDALRASGLPPSVEEAKKAGEDADAPVAVELPDERERTFRTPGFSRMRMEWSSSDRRIIQRSRDTAEGRVLHSFSDAYQIMNAVYDIVRTPEVNEDGEPVRDRWGFKVWHRDEHGGFDEDFTRMTRAQREHLLFAITTRLFDWEQRAADLWGEAMMAKAQWEERFAIAYDAPMSGTIDDRNAVARKDSAEERYFAILVTWTSRKAEALVRTMTALALRLRDSMEF